MTYLLSSLALLCIAYAVQAWRESRRVRPGDVLCDRSVRDDPRTPTQWKG